MQASPLREIDEASNMRQIVTLAKSYPTQEATCTAVWTH
jgi:hypothetical protein